MSFPPLTPPVDNTRAPPMHEMDWQRLERLTVDLFGYEPNISTSDDYGVSGQTDHGVDVLARRADGDGEEVASCKVRTEIEAKDLVKWSNAFLEHWDDNWSARDIRRFVLATTATNTGDKNIQDQVTAERTRFKELGVAYELWGPKQFVKKLRPHRPIAATYLGEVWADSICGPAQSFGVQTGPGAALISASAVSQLSDLQEKLSGQAAKRAESALDDLRTGKLEAVRSFLEELRAPDVWNQIHGPVQERILRLAASLALRDGDVDSATSFNDQAEAISPAEEPRLAAHIALEREGIAAAIEVLGTPTSVSGKQLLASLLMMADREADAGVVIAELAGADTADPETTRLLALHKLRQHDRIGALETIHQAELQAPDWIAILQAGVIVRYALALSPAVGPEWFMWPNPVDAALVREDRQAQAYLEEALHLQERWQPVATGRSEARLWRVAILANLRNRQHEAVEAAAAILSGQPDEPTVIGWCLTRHLEVDLSASREALRSRYEAGTDQMHARVLGLMLIMGAGGSEEADYLASHLAAQPQAAKEEAERWIARLRGDVAVGAVPGSDEGDVTVDTLRAAQANGDWSQVPELLQSAFSSDPPEPVGLSLAQMIADVGKWELLDNHIDGILRYGTAAAVRLAAFAASRNGNAAKTLSIIDQHLESFGEGPPADLRRLRADALARTGDVQGAVREIEQITATTGLAADRLFRAELMVGIGDLRGSVPAVREALRDGALTPAHALRWSRLLQEEEPELSRQLWRMAVAGDLSDQFVVAAMHQAFQLGLDNEAASLMPRVKARAAAGTKEIRLASLDEVKDLLSAHRRTAEENQQLYLKGLIPSHLYVRGKLQVFAHLYLGRGEDAGGRLLVRLIRNGARPREIPYGQPWNDWVIHLDISGLFEAYRLELLDHLESHPQAVRISSRLPNLLIEMQQAVHPTQPARVAAARDILQHVEGGCLAVVDAAPADTFVVSLERAQDSERTYTLAELVTGLAALGLLTDKAAEDVRTRLNVKADTPAIPLERGSALHFEGVTLEEVASVELLPVLIANFQPTTERADMDRIEREVAAADEGDRLAAVLGGLRQRIADGLQSGVYVTLPIVKEDESGEDDSGDNVLIQSFQDILEAAGIENGVVWIDDRLVSGYPRTGTMPLIGITDAIAAIAKQGIINEEERDRKLAVLRASGAAFIPFATEEVTGPLLQAKVVDHELVETDELRTIRKSFAAAGRLEKYLKIGETDDGPPNRPDEVETARAAMRLLGNALDGVWNATNLTGLERYAYSDWLWSNLRVTRLNRIIPAEDPEAAQDFFEVMQIGHCLDKAIDIGGINDRRKEVRLQFLNWMWQRVVRPKAAVDASFEERLAGYLADFYRSLLKKDREKESRRDRAILNRLLVLRIERLPDPVRMKVLNAPYFAHFVTTKQHVTVGRVKFEPARFWKAARAALLYGAARVRTVDGQKVRLRGEDGSLVLSGGVRTRIGEELLRVIASRGDAIGTAVTRYLNGLELEPDATARLTAQAIAAPTPGQLAAVLHEARSLSVSNRYVEIQQKLSSRRTFDTDVLLPATLGKFSAFLAFDPDTEDFTTALGSSLRTLSGRHGKVEALRRLSGVPVALADLVTEMGDGDPDALAKQARTPLALVLAAALLRKFGRDSAAVARVLERLAQTTKAYGPLFVSLLRWTYRGFYRDPAWRKAPPAVRLGVTWAHADRLLDIFIRTRSDPAVAKAHFDENLPDIAGPDVLAARTMGVLDLAAPDAISPAALLFHGLAYIFGADNLTAEVPSELVERLQAQLIVQVGEVVSPHPTLMMRRPDAPNVLRGYLDRRPVGLLEDRLDPDQTRETLLEGALGSLEADESAASPAWAQLAAISAGGVSVAQRERLAAIVVRSDLWSIARATQERQFIQWRIIVTLLVDHDRNLVIETVAQLAAKCRRAYGSRIDATGDVERREAQAAFSELIEIAAVIASRDDPGQEGRGFVDILYRILAEWPEAARALRPIVDHLLATTIASRSGPLWELSLYLRTFA